MQITLISACVVTASAHGAMSHPRPRNAYSAPATHASGSGDDSCVGDACYWYQVGCHIGCPSCTLQGKDLYPAPHCSAEEGLLEPTNNDPEFRTWDPHGQSECGDFTKHNPWRAPGKAPVADPCGVASGFANPGTKKADVPGGYHGGDKGSEVLKETDPTYWQAGATAAVGWGLSAQHGGGYSYRLCPKSSSMTEACFQSNTLKFAGVNSTVHFDDGSHTDIQIPAKTYTAEDGTQWRPNPIPGCACDNGLSCGSKDRLRGQSGGHCAPGTYPKNTPYATHGSSTPNCPRGTMFEAGFDEFTQGFLVGNGNKFSVMDEVEVPNTPGEYVLSWRWDCEETDQVWNSCADILIVDGPAPAPTPAPTPPPSPAPTPGQVCDGFKPDKASFACYYKGCAEYEEGSKDCKTCCEGCHVESDPSKGTYCMEDTATV